MKRLIRWALNHVPRPLLQRLAGWAVPVAGLFYVGRGRECPVCGARRRRFLPYGDVLICNHLLEHVADDRRALGEFYRILRPGGWGILLSPVDRSRAATFEDDSITDPEERTRIFGQYDHRRIYGCDYGGRLREAGFAVREIDYAARFSAEERRRYALPDDWIYVVRRPL